jgi:hypothetical protein
MQSVGCMSVIPLILDMEEDNRFAPPTDLWASNKSYGQINLENKQAIATIAPVGATYLTKQNSQDHALTRASFIPAGRKVDIRDAACVQSSQGGYIRDEQTPLLILPYAIREAAIKKIGDTEAGKLWRDIGAFNRLAGCSRGSDHLEYFTEKYNSVMDQFVAEFEIVPNQVGAIIMIDGKVHGVERAPNQAFWRGVWTPLIRMCYGSQAIIFRSKNKNAQPKMTPINRRGVNSINDLADALEKAEKKDKDNAVAVVTSLLDEDFALKNKDSHQVSGEGRTSTIKQQTVENDQFIGQMFTDGPQVCYASVVTKTGWMQHASWRSAKKFEM